MYDLAILGGNVVSSDSVEVADVLIKDGVIVQVLPAKECGGASARGAVNRARAEREVDARGMLVMPGVIDPHVHFELRSRGTVTADDFASGTRCAAAGGVTTVIDYADHLPGTTLSQCAAARLSEIRPQAAVDYAVHQNCIRIDHDIGDQLAELCRAGIGSVKVFTTYKDAGYMLEGGDLEALLRAAKHHDVLVTVHAEDDALIEQARGRLEAAGHVSPEYHGESRPAEAEERAVRNVIAAAKAADAPVYFVHVSTRGAMEAIAEGRREGQQVMAETCPHYLLLDEGRYSGADARLFIMSPPLRTQADHKVLWAAAAAGGIDTFSTDHCAFTPEQKALGRSCFDTLPGIPGVQTLLPLIYTYGVATGTITVGQMVKMMCENPARLFGISCRKGRIAPGLDADIVILDRAARRRLRGVELLSQAGYTPYEGMEVSCDVREVYLRGNLVAAHGRFCGACGAGEFVRASA
ncbi:MAG TPA: dihydropyrimidinase [Bacillota bacterium]|nr:dihydropyrimidinase [Bacillota bacterium]